MSYCRYSFFSDTRLYSFNPFFHPLSDVIVKYVLCSMPCAMLTLLGNRHMYLCERTPTLRLCNRKFFASRFPLLVSLRYKCNTDFGRFLQFTIHLASLKLWAICRVFSALFRKVKQVLFQKFELDDFLTELDKF